MNLDFDPKQTAKTIISTWIGYQLAGLQLPPEIMEQFVKALPYLVGGLLDCGYWLVVVRWLKIGLPR